MAMSINKKMLNDESGIYYNRDFRRFLETYMFHLRKGSEEQIENIDPHDAYKYEGDFYGLLQVLGVNPNIHWLVMRINDLTNPSESDETIRTIILPNETVIERLSQLYQSLERKKEKLEKTGS